MGNKHIGTSLDEAIKSQLNDLEFSCEFKKQAEISAKGQDPNDLTEGNTRGDSLKSKINNKTAETFAKTDQDVEVIKPKSLEALFKDLNI